MFGNHCTNNACVSPTVVDDGSTTAAPAARYEADVEPYGPGRFVVTGRGVDLIVIHADAERQFCHELAQRGVSDGPILFFRADHGSKASLSFKSIYRAAKYRTALGNRFPRLELREAPRSAKDKARRLRASAAGGVSAFPHAREPRKKESVYGGSAPTP